VVAIIAALVGVAVPFFQDNIAEARRAKAGEDLEVIKKAVVLYEQKQGKLLLGTALSPLLGRFMQEIPVDPWGNPYLFEGNVGFLGSYGADALPGGTGGDQDIIVGGTQGGGINFTMLPVFMRRAQYQGAWGRPALYDSVNKYATGSKFILTYTRPFSISDPDNSMVDFRLLSENYDKTYSAALMSDPSSWVPNTWKAADNTAFAGLIDPLHRPHEGVFVIRCNEENRQTPTAVPVRPSSRITNRHPTDPPGTDLTLVSTYTPNGNPSSPMDPAVYGAVVADWMPEILGPPEDKVTGLVGLRVERY
jgi:general secretion pathway protein G